MDSRFAPRLIKHCSVLVMRFVCRSLSGLVETILIQFGKKIMTKKKSDKLQQPALATEKPSGGKSHPVGLPSDIAAIRKEISAFFDSLDENGRKIGGHKWGVYAFYDYDGEPIYVGQTYEGVRSRISRHLTNQRTDAVAMNVLDPFEVAEIEVWLIWELQNKKSGDAESKAILNAAE